MNVSDADVVNELINIIINMSIIELKSFIDLIINQGDNVHLNSKTILPNLQAYYNKRLEI